MQEHGDQSNSRRGSSPPFQEHPEVMTPGSVSVSSGVEAGSGDSSEGDVRSSGKTAAGQAELHMGPASDAR